MESKTQHGLDIEPAPPQPISRSFRLFGRAIGLTFLFLGGLIIISCIGFSIFIFYYLSRFNAVAGLTWTQSYQVFKQTFAHPIQHTDYRKNILVLGTDSLEMRGDVPPLTDTMILMSIDLDSGQVYLLSLPRDLYSAKFQTKINALYAYGQDRFPANPYVFPERVLSELLNQSIHHTLVISLDQLQEIIDQIGGIQVEVTQGFIDEKYPRSNVDIHQETDPEKLYQKIEFIKGTQEMTGSRAIQYIRSRNASGEAGTDVARSNRQQQVITALVTKLLSKSVLLSPQTTGQLYSFYDRNYASYLPIKELTASAKLMISQPGQISLHPVNLSIYPDEEQGVIKNPPQWLYKGQWVYQIRDQESFEKEVVNLLELES